MWEIKGLGPEPVRSWFAQRGQAESYRLQGHLMAWGNSHWTLRLTYDESVVNQILLVEINDASLGLAFHRWLTITLAIPPRDIKYLGDRYEDI